MKRLTAAFVVVLASTAAAGGEEGLAHGLPANTVLYVGCDLGRLADQFMDHVEFIDADRAEAIRHHARTLIGGVRELLSHQEFTPAVLESPAAVDVHFVIVPKREPEVEVQTYKMPKWNPETGSYVEGEFEEHHYTRRREYTMSLVVETPDEDVASDFLRQFRAFQERMRDETGAEGFGFGEVEVDAGEMIAEPNGSSTFGRLGRRLVFSDSKPTELWQALMSPPDPSLGDSPLHGSLKGPGEGPPIMVLVNTGELVRRAEEAVVRALREAEEQYGTLLEGQQPANPGQWRVWGAQRELAGFKTMKRMFSLDRIGAVGVEARMEVTEAASRQSGTVAAHLDPPLSPVVEAILDGGRRLEAPQAGDQEGLLVMARVGMRGVWEGIAAELGPEAMGPFMAGMAAVKAQIGYYPAELIEFLSGDMYLYFDIEKKEHVAYAPDPETGEWAMRTQESPLPEFLLLLGLEDGEAAANAFSNIHTALSKTPIATILSKRTFLEQDVYLFGQGVAEEGAEPDGLTSFAVTVSGRYLAFGSWKGVSGLVRKVNAGRSAPPEHVRQAVARHPEANLLVVMPPSFGRRMQEMMKEQDGDPLENLKAALAMMPIPEEERELAERMKDALTRLMEDFLAVGEQVQKRTIGAIGHGRREGRFYRFQISEESRRK